MKDSGVPWIGDIPKDWTISKVKYSFIRKNEKAHQDNPIVLSLARSGVRVRDLTNNEGQIAESYYDYNPVDEGDLLLNPMDLYSGANCSISHVVGVISPAYVNLRYKNGVATPSYYDYYFKTQYWSMAMFAHGKGVSFDNRWTLGIDTLFNYYIPVPSLLEQQRIADFLDTKCAEIDSILEQTKASIEEYKKLKQIVITEAVTKGIRGERPMKESGVEWIGEIPAEWRVCKMNHAITILAGYAFPSDGFTQQGVRLLRGINVTPTGIRWNETVYWENLIDSSTEPYQLYLGDLVLGMDRPWIKEGTRVAFVKETDLPCLLLQRVCRLRPRNTSDIGFIYWVFVSRLFEEALTTDTTGISVPHISTGQVEAFRFALPSKSEQQEIASFLDEKCAAIDSLIASKEALIAELETYKKSLIYEYVTGKKEVL